MTNCPSKLSQKSRPYLSGWSVPFTNSRREILFGTANHPSDPVSRELKETSGGLRSVALLELPRIRGIIGLVDESTVRSDSESISVKRRSLGLFLLRYSETRPDTRMASPTRTCLAALGPYTRSP